MLREILFLKGSARGLYLLVLPLTAAFLVSDRVDFNPSGIRMAWIILSISSMTASLSSLEADRGNDLLRSTLTGRGGYLPTAVKFFAALWGPLVFLFLFPLIRVVFYEGNGVTALHLKGFFWALTSVAWASAVYCLGGKPVHILSAMSLILLTINLPLGLPGMDLVPADGSLALAALGIPALLVFSRASRSYLKSGHGRVETSPSVLYSEAGGEK